MSLVQKLHKWDKIPSTLPIDSFLHIDSRTILFLSFFSESFWYSRVPRFIYIHICFPEWYLPIGARTPSGGHRLPTLSDFKLRHTLYMCWSPLAPKRVDRSYLDYHIFSAGYVRVQLVVRWQRQICLSDYLRVLELVASSCVTYLPVVIYGQQFTTRYRLLPENYEYTFVLYCFLVHLLEFS